jgi:hypothetical protein
MHTAEMPAIDVVEEVMSSRGSIAICKPWNIGPCNLSEAWRYYRDPLIAKCMACRHGGFVKGSTSRVGFDKDIEYASRARCNMRLNSDIFHPACSSLMKQRCMIGYRPSASCPDNHVLVVDTLE